VTTVTLMLPEEVIRELELSADAFRGSPDALLAIEGVNAAASIITLSTLRSQLPRLAREC
jgi:hypothetical protein